MPYFERDTVFVTEEGRFVYSMTSNGETWRYDTYEDVWTKLRHRNGPFMINGPTPSPESQPSNPPNTQVVDFRKLDVD